MLEELRKEIQKAGNPEKVKAYMWFFKTGKGEYGEGDIFVGVTVPLQRKIALKYKTLPLNDIKLLLQSKIHEERLIALFILVSQFTKGNKEKQKEIYEFYLRNTKYINNWDLVDSSAYQIVGEYLYRFPSPFKGEGQDEGKNLQASKIGNSAPSPRPSPFEGEGVLTRLAESENLWERRIAMMATFAFIKSGDTDVAFKIADILLNDTHDLIHKAVGWMLREIGQRISQETEESFLKTRYKSMPRTMLRYAIEKFPEEKRKKYLQGKV